MMLVMCELGEGRDGLDGVEAVIRGFIKKYDED